MILSKLWVRFLGRPDDDLLPDKKVNLAFEAQGAGQPKNLTQSFDKIIDKYKAELKKQKDEVARLTKANRDLAKDKETLASEKLQLEQAHKDNYDGLATKLKEEKKQEGDASVKLKEIADDRSKQIAKLEKEKADATAAANAAVAAAKGEVAQAQVEKEKLRKTIESFERPTESGPKNLNTGWRVVALDRGGDMAYINLGSADKVKPQLRFTVHGVEADGKPMEHDKAVLEVVEVKDQHLSRGRILYLDERSLSGDRRHDRNRDPVLSGDVLVNPSWTPNVAKHVALVGVVDLTGEGRDNTEEFLRALSRQNIIIDSVIDARTVLDDDAALDAALKKVTVQTDFMVVGEVPAYLREGRDTEKRGAKLQAAIDKMKEAAKQNGVRIVGLRKYLEMIGYETPRALDSADRASSSIYRSKVEPKPDAPKKDDMKKDDMKKDEKPAN
jgi:hypothetical protein